jgi:hypothetical protein
MASRGGPARRRPRVDPTAPRHTAGPSPRPSRPGLRRAVLVPARVQPTACRRSVRPRRQRYANSASPGGRPHERPAACLQASHRQVAGVTTCAVRRLSSFSQPHSHTLDGSHSVVNLPLLVSLAISPPVSRYGLQPILTRRSWSGSAYPTSNKRDYQGTDCEFYKRA